MDNLELIALSDIEDPGLRAPRWLVRSIEHQSQRRPVVLGCNPKDMEGDYLIYDGKRRIAALTELGRTQVIALVCEDENEVNHAIETLVGNLGERNPGAEAEAVEILLGEGYNEERIVKEVGLDKKTVTDLIRLKQALHPVAFEKVKVGQLPLSTAKQMLRLSPEEQGMLAMEEKVRAKDVKAVVRARSQDLLAGLEQITIPTLTLEDDLAQQIEGAALFLMGRERQTLIDAAEILRRHQNTIPAVSLEAAG
jgi:ParB/RepB/Spo0J family partition protein